MDNRHQIEWKIVRNSKSTRADHIETRHAAFTDGRISLQARRGGNRENHIRSRRNHGWANKLGRISIGIVAKRKRQNWSRAI